MLKDRIAWPEGKDASLMVSINLDVEYFAKLYYPDEEIDLESGEIASLGKESLECGLPRILDTLDDFGVSATFFIPAVIAEKYPAHVKEIAKRGHEIACRGNHFENLGRLSATEQRKVLSHAKEVLEDVSGKEVQGFRMSGGEITEETLQILKDLGFVYSSCLGNNDIPYVHKESSLVELPIHWELYDLPYYAYTFDPPIPPGQDRCSNASDVLENWLFELEGAEKFGTLMILQIDPQSTGEQGRIFVLEKVLEEAKKRSVWIAGGRKIADHVLKTGN